MADDLDKLDFKSGDPLRAQDLQAIVDAIKNPGADMRGGPGLDVRKGARGQLQLSGLQPYRRYLAIANGDIPARSGTTPGAGVATIQRFDGTDLFSEGPDLDVLNASSTTMTSGNGIDDGMYCWVAEDEDGWLWCAPLECS